MDDPKATALKDTRKKVVHRIKKDAHTGKRSEMKPKTYVDGSVVRDVKDKKRDRVHRAYTRARRISEKVQLNNDIHDDLIEHQFFCYNNIPDSDSSSNDEISTVIEGASITPSEFGEKLGSTISNLFINGEVDAAIDDLKQLYDADYKRLIIYVVIEKSLNFKSKHRELISRYLAQVSMAEILDQFDFMKGFDLLLSDLDDLSIDFPEASNHLAIFLARAISDECLPPIYLRNQLQIQKRSNIRKCLKHAKFQYMHMSRYVDIDKIWGEEAVVTGIQDLLQSVFNIVDRFIQDEDYDRFFNSVTELDVPHFHHAFIREIINILIADHSEPVHEKVVSLITHIIDTSLMTDEQIEQGFSSVCEDVKKLKLDQKMAVEIILKLISDLKSKLPKTLTEVVSAKIEALELNHV